MSPRIPDEQRALLAAVVAEPDADAPRLVYADWLEEHGDEMQAGFIRDSIWFDRSCKDNDRVQQRIEVDSEAFGKRWIEAVGFDQFEPTYARGMAEGAMFAIQYSFYSAVERGLFERLPIRGVVIADLRDSSIAWEDVRKLAGIPELKHLHTLQLIGDDRAWESARYDAGAWLAFFQSPHLRNLRRLGLFNCFPSANDLSSDIAALVAADLPALRHLAFGDAWGRTDILRRVARSTALRNVTDFWVCSSAAHGFPSTVYDEDAGILDELTARFGDGLHLVDAPDFDPADLTREPLHA